MLHVIYVVKFISIKIFKEKKTILVFFLNVLGLTSAKRCLRDSRKELGDQSGKTQPQDECGPSSRLSHSLLLITSVPGRKRI